MRLSPLCDRWESAYSTTGSFWQSYKTLLLSHLGCLRLWVNFAKSILSPSQRISFLGTIIDSVQMTTTVSAERATTIQRHTASFQEGTAYPLKGFQKILDLMSAASPVLQMGRFQQGMESTVLGQTDLCSLVRKGVRPAHQLPRNASIVPCLSILPAGHTGTPCASTLRQQVRGVINHPGGLNS